MQRFANLYEQLDRTTSTSAKVAALVTYFEQTPAADAAWGLYFLSGQKLHRVTTARTLRTWCRRRSGVRPWLFTECYAVVGDLAETITLLMERSAASQPAASNPARVDEPGTQMMFMDLLEEPEPDDEDGGLAWWVEHRLAPLRGLEPVRQIGLLDAWTRDLPATQLFLLIKMLTGALRIGVSRTLVERALAAHAGVEPAIMAHRLAGSWEPGADALAALLAPDAGSRDVSRPYPFFLAAPIRTPAPEDAGALTALEHELGSARDWLVEWKWDGIRAQLIHREHQVHLWSRGHEDLTSRFPEITAAAEPLGDGVLDGELLCWDHAARRPLGFGVLQRRIGRERLSTNVLAAAPAVFMAYDLLEHDGDDVRAKPIEARRLMLERMLAKAGRTVLLGEQFAVDSWTAAATLRAGCRARGVEGLMLKRRGSRYLSGRRRGDWWKWKIDPLTIDAVLVYAQPGHGRRANLLTDYTFAVWEHGSAGDAELVTVTRAYSGLTDEEFRELDRWIRRHTVERFGPVRAVEPEQVFELAFDEVRASERHKAGVAFRFPRMKRWRRDQPASEADTLEAVRELMQP